MYRDETREHFTSILNPEPLFQCLSSNGRESIIKQLESSCNDANIDYAKRNHIPSYWDDETFVENYSSIIYRVSMNLDPTSSINVSMPNQFGRTLINRVLLTALLSDSESQSLLQTLNTKRAIDRLGIDLKQIGYMTSVDLNSYPSEQYLEEIAVRAAQKVEIKTTKMHPCPQCHKRNATEYRLQTRSGDEGYTTFIQCCYCEHRWTSR
jgi:DNA-directed RNA polymerase subunit M/transcription elongation factor TFIIS